MLTTRNHHDLRTPTMDQTWATIRRLVTWLDEQAAADGDTARLLRVMKVHEETGEVAEALANITDPQAAHDDPGTWDDVKTELCDVIVTGMVALASLTPDADPVLETGAHALTAHAPAPSEGVWGAAAADAEPARMQGGMAPVVERILLLVADAGSVAEAVHGALGANPRKGASHTWADVADRLAAVIVRAMSLLWVLTSHAEKVFDARLARIAERSGVLP